MTRTKIAVLDDNTRAAHIIGYAANETEAAKMFSDYMKDRMDADDFADLKIPDFYYRSETSVVSPAYEPFLT